MPAPLHRKPQGSVEPGNLIHPKPLGLAFPEPHPSHRNPILDFIIQRHCVPPQMKPCGQCLQPLPGAGVYQLGRLEGNSGMEKVVPAPYLIQLAPNARA